MVVLDNSTASDVHETVEAFRDKLPEINLIQNRQPLGAPKSNLAAAELARSRYIVPLDSRNVALESGLLKAIKFLEDDPGLAVIYGSWQNVGEGDNSAQTVNQNLSGLGRRSLRDLREFLEHLFELKSPVMRREAYERTLLASHYSHAFNIGGMVDMLRFGDVFFMEDPIYRSEHCSKADADALFREDNLSSYLADYELAATIIPDLTKEQRSEFLAQRISRHYLLAAQAAVDKGQFLEARNLIIRSRAYGNDAADQFAQALAEKIAPHIVAQMIHTSMLPLDTPSLLLAEDHLKTRPIVHAFDAQFPDIETRIVGADELISSAYNGGTFVLYAQPGLPREREAQNRAAIRSGALIDDLLDRCQLPIRYGEPKDRKFDIHLAPDAVVDGYTIYNGNITFHQLATYVGNGVVSDKSCDFIKDPRFARAYAKALELACPHEHSPESMHNEWPLMVLLWAASVGMALEGDFVECGVYKGFSSIALVDYFDFQNVDKKLYLIDTYAGIPLHQVSDEEADVAAYQNPYYAKEGIYETTQRNFAGVDNALVVRGEVPSVFSELEFDKIAYLSVDMNCVEPEMAAAEYFWDKLVKGGVIVVDDYGWPCHRIQYNAWNDFAVRKGVTILPTAVGTGIIIKP